MPARTWSSMSTFLLIAVIDETIAQNVGIGERRPRCAGRAGGARGADRPAKADRPAGPLRASRAGLATRHVHKSVPAPRR